MSHPLKVLLVEDHKLTRESMAFGLRKFPSLQVVGEAENGQTAVAMVEKHRPDVILMDIMMPVLNGICATQKIKQQYPDIKVIMLTSHGEQEKVFSAFSAGADGYCLKEIKFERLVQAIDMVMEGVLWVDPGIAHFILQVIPRISPTGAAPLNASRMEDEGDDSATELSNREKELLKLLADGLNNKDIAATLNISVHTVKNHVKNIIRKLSVEDRTQAAVLALKKGLI